MLQVLLWDYNIFISILLNFVLYWVLFFKANYFSAQVNYFYKTKIKITSEEKTLDYLFYLKLNQVFLFMELIYFYTIRGESTLFWNSHFKLSNFLIFILILLLLLNFFFLKVTESTYFSTYSYKPEYFFALINLSLFLPIIFLSNTLFTFLFILEVNSSLIFYKFIVSRFWFKKNILKNKSEVYNFYRLLPKNYLNMLFFQYWATFFSSIMILFSIIVFFYMFGTTEWTLVNYLVLLNFNINYFNVKSFLVTLNILLLFAFLVKIGFTPIQLYKIEIYKGLPYLAIFFYTTYYFLVFFLFFTILLIYFLSSMSYIWGLLLMFIILVGTFYVIILMFDINILKVFFAYSTLINSIGFVILVLSLIS